MGGGDSLSALSVKNNSPQIKYYSRPPHLPCSSFPIWFLKCASISMDFKAHSLEFLEHSLLLRGKKKKKNILACAIFVILISKNSWSCAAQTVVFSTHCSDFFLLLLSSYRLPPLLFPHKSASTPAYTTLNITYICHGGKREAASPSRCCARAQAMNYPEGGPKSLAKFSLPHRHSVYQHLTLSQSSSHPPGFMLFLFFFSAPSG